MPTETPLNSQILDAARYTQALVAGAAGETADGIVYSQVAAALGLAVENAVAHLQHLQTVEVAVLSRATALILADPESAGGATLALELAQRAVRDAIEEIRRTSTEAAEILRGFPGRPEAPRPATAAPAKEAVPAEGPGDDGPITH